jgi:gas vesicle protein
MDRDSASGFGIGMLVGVAVGLAVGMLYAPKTGRETRQMVRERTGEVVDKARQGISRLKGRTKEDEETTAEL